jgi:Cu-Zn family superoxide dismutase
MRRSTKINIGLLLGTLIAFGGGGFYAAAGGGGSDGGPNVIRAQALMTGPSGVEGVVYFTESPVDKYGPVSEVSVVAHITGLVPGLHGFHVHENGICEPPAFASAGGHFDPGPFGSSTPVDANHPYHAGDLAQLEANPGEVAHLEYETSRFTLRQNPGNQLSLFDANGSAVIVHQNPDLGLNGVLGASGGPRVACGIIVPTEP